MRHFFKHLVAMVLGVFLSQPVLSQESQRRFKLLSNDEMSAEQKKLAASIRSGPRAAVAGSAANTSNAIGSPFNVFLRSPELGEPLQQVGSYIRFKSTLGMRLNELAILITARHWNSQYEWYAHHRLALQAGLNPQVAQDIADGRRPKNMLNDETIIYNFSTELHQNKRVSDASFQAMVEQFGEQGAMDLIGAIGYYTLVAMVLNVDRTPLPGGGTSPLQ